MASIQVVGPGGAIRLVANTIVASGFAQLRALGGLGSNCFLGSSDGRIRIESFQLLGSISYARSFSPSIGLPGPVLPGANSPVVLITSIGGQSVPATPQASYFGTPDVTLSPSVPNPIPVQLQANNVPLGTAIAVTVVTEGIGTRSTFTSSPLVGTLASSAATVYVHLPTGTSVLTATATFMP